MSGPYDDLLNLPHHVSATRPRMPKADRAAQFAPFAALRGYEAAVQETARETEEMRELSDDARQELDATLRCLQSRLAESPRIRVTWFVPDDRKDGGAYHTQEGRLRQLHPAGRLTLEDGEEIEVRNVWKIKVLT